MRYEETRDGLLLVPGKLTEADLDRAVEDADSMLTAAERRNGWANAQGRFPLLYDEDEQDEGPTAADWVSMGLMLLIVLAAVGALVGVVFFWPAIKPVLAAWGWV